MQQTIATIWQTQATPTQQLLLGALRAALNPDQPQVCPGQAGDIGALLDLAERHRVVPLLNAGLKRADLAEAERERLRVRVRSAAFRSAQLTAELAIQLQRLAAAGVPAIPYKGPALAQQLYANPAMRQSSDLDILVRPADLLPARAVLLADGYEPLPAPEGYRLDAAHLRRFHEYSLIHPRRYIRCELQWSLMEVPYRFPPPASLERWRNTSSTVTLGGYQSAVLDLEATMLILALHGAKHLWERLQWLCDIAALLQRPLDWERVQVEARALGVTGLLLTACTLASELLATPLPATLSPSRRQAARVQHLAVQALPFVLRIQEDQAAAPAARNLFLIGGLDRLSQRIGSGMQFAPRLLRPVQFYRRYGRKPLEQLFGWRQRGTDTEIGQSNEVTP